MNEAAPWPRAVRWSALAALILAAAAVRIYIALTTGAIHPDEVFQYLEPAHRAVFGYGVVTWEYRYGMRSWLLPLLLSVPMRLGDMVAPESQLYLAFPRIMMALSSLIVLPAAYALGARLSRMHGIVALIVAAFWFEIVYFGGHVLTEPAATALILPAAALLMGDKPSARRIALAGLLLGLAAILRFQYLPAIGVLALACCWPDWRRMLPPLILGGLAAAAIGAAVDLGSGMTPFGWFFENINQNFVANRSADFGVSPPLAYLATMSDAWGIFFIPIVLLALIVARTHYPLLLAALVNLGAHSAIGHKEYRFILLTVAILIVTAAIGSAELVRRAAPRFRTARFGPALLILAWLGASAFVSSRGWLRESWQPPWPATAVTTQLRQVPSLCGVGLVDVNFWDTGGYSHLHRPVPIYVAASRIPGVITADFAAVAPAFNAIVAPPGVDASLPQGYRRLSCAPALSVPTASAAAACVYVRPGGSDPRAAAVQRLEAVMARRDW